MALTVKILKVTGVLNVLFILLYSNTYSISSEYLSNAAVIAALIVLVILSFSKDIFERIGIVIENASIKRLLNFTSLLVSGVLSSLVLLIPKLLFIESHKLDSLPIKFTVKITRLWSREELSICLNELIDNRGVRDLISDQDHNSIIESSSSMGELKTSLSSLVKERLVVIDPATVTTIINKANETSWISENALLITVVSIIAVTVIVGAGYLMYRNYHSSVPSEDRSIFTGTEENPDEFLRKDLFDDLSSVGSESEGFEKSLNEVQSKLEQSIEGLSQKLLNTEKDLHAKTETLLEVVTSNEANVINIRDYFNKEVLTAVQSLADRTVVLENGAKSLKASVVEDMVLNSKITANLGKDLRKELMALTLGEEELKAIRGLLGNETIQNIAKATKNFREKKG